MKQIPKTENALLLRIDFSDQAAWEQICRILREPVGDLHFLANVDFLDDKEYADVTKDQLLKLISPDYNHTFIIVADHSAISRSDHPLLVLDLYESPGQELRAIPSEIQSIENNLSIANMDFEEFAGAVDEDGVFRGFPKL